MGEPGLKIPSCYVDGYEAARRVDPELAETYIRHTTVGDPAADAVVEELAAIAAPKQVHGIIAATLEHWDELPADTPESLRNLVAESAVVPDWFDPGLAMSATRAFLRNSDMVLGGLIAGAIIEGFSTLISKSFRIRSRIVTNGVRRLKQNLLQLLEQYLPGGMEPGADGWTLSLRIRLVHAQARMLIGKESEEWDAATYGMPLSAAHMLLGAATFSGRLMQHVTRLGGDFDDREREAYVHVWRYTARVMGVPEAILFRDFASAVRAFEVAVRCEPPPDFDSIIMANSIINSAPIVLGFIEPPERRSKAAYVYQVSRELIGNEQADKLRFPRGKLKKELPFLQLRNFGDRLLRLVLPPLGRRRSSARFRDMLEVSDLGQYEHSYSLPNSVFDEDSRAW